MNDLAHFRVGHWTKPPARWGAPQFLHEHKASPAEFKAGLDEAAIRRGWLLLHESGTYVKFTPAGAALFA
jgi:hypothetical protein